MDTSKNNAEAWNSNLNLFVQNNSSFTLLAYHVTHQCGTGTLATSSGCNLAAGAMAPLVPTTSQSGDKDNYTVKLMWADGNQGNTSFYCNAGSKDNSILISIKDDNCDCNYYESNNLSGPVDSSCDNKGSWTS